MSRCQWHGALGVLVEPACAAAEVVGCCLCPTGLAASWRWALRPASTARRRAHWQARELLCLRLCDAGLREAQRRRPQPTAAQPEHWQARTQERGCTTGRPASRSMHLVSRPFAVRKPRSLLSRAAHRSADGKPSMPSFKDTPFGARLPVPAATARTPAQPRRNVAHLARRLNPPPRPGVRRHSPLPPYVCCRQARRRGAPHPCEVPHPYPHHCRARRQERRARHRQV
jgi:hypothetical protein